MAYFPDVQPGMPVRFSAQRETAINRLLNQADSFKTGVIHAKSQNVVRVQVWNSTQTAFAAGQAVQINVSGSLCGNAFPAVNFASIDATFGVCATGIAPNAIGDLILSGPATVMISGTTGSYAKPVSGGTFARGDDGVKILHISGTTAIVLLGDYHTESSGSGEGGNQSGNQSSGNSGDSIQFIYAPGIYSATNNSKIVVVCPPIIDDNNDTVSLYSLYGSLTPPPQAFNDNSVLFNGSTISVFGSTSTINAIQSRLGEEELIDYYAEDDENKLGLGGEYRDASIIVLLPRGVPGSSHLEFITSYDAADVLLVCTDGKRIWEAGENQSTLTYMLGSNGHFFVHYISEGQTSDWPLKNDDNIYDTYASSVERDGGCWLVESI